MRTRFLLLFASTLLLLSCEKKDYSPHISPNWFTLSEKNAEVHVEVDPDCEMWGFNMDESPMFPVTKEIKEKSMSIQPIDEHHQATIYCKEDQVEKIDFGVMTIEKEGKGKYKILFTPKDGLPVPQFITCGFMSAEGRANLVILFKRQIRDTDYDDF